MPKSSIDPIVVRNLKVAFKRQGRSAYSVANALGHPSNWLYQVLKEKCGLLIPSLREIARELGVSVSSLVDAEEDIPETDIQAGPDAAITGQRLATARRKTGKTQNELAVALGNPYNQRMISEVESGQGNLPLKRAAVAARKLGISLDYLAGLTDDTTPPTARNVSTPEPIPAHDTPGSFGASYDALTERTAKSKKTLWPSPIGADSMTISPNIQHIRGRIAEIGILQADLN